MFYKNLKSIDPSYRKVFFFSIYLSLDLFLFKNFILICKDIGNIVFEIPMLLYLYISWILFSYLFKRYDQLSIKSFFSSYLAEIKFSSFSLLFILISFISVSSDSSILVSLDYFYLISLLSKLILMMSLVKTMCFGIYKRFYIDKFYWVFWGERDEVEYLKNLLSLLKRKIKIKYIYSSDEIYKIDHYLCLGIIKSDRVSYENYSIQKNNINKYKKTLNLEEWLEKEIKIIPHDIYINQINEFKLTLNLSEKNSLSNQINISIKRIFDIAFSVLLFITILPIFLVINLLVLINDGLPTIYKQIRVGKNGSLFNIYKIRTMIKKAEKNGAQWSTKNDKRVLFIGKYLRKMRLDEIPQLISVIQGKMSLIGPRPERPEIEEDLKLKIPFYNLKHLIKPGISGHAQVSYRYGASVSDSSIKLGFDLFYIKHQSLFLDFLIFFKTVKNVINMTGSESIK